jgi:hypothetical protein
VQGAAASLWSLAVALALRDAAEILQHLLQGHGLAPMYNADLLAETLGSCATAVLWLYRRGIAPLQLETAELVQQLHEAEAAAAAAAAVTQAAGTSPADPASRAAATGPGPLKGFSSKELRSIISVRLVEQLLDFSKSCSCSCNR